MLGKFLLIKGLLVYSIKILEKSLNENIFIILFCTNLKLQKNCEYCDI